MDTPTKVVHDMSHKIRQKTDVLRKQMCCVINIHLCVQPDFKVSILVKTEENSRVLDLTLS